MPDDNDERISVARPGISGAHMELQRILLYRFPDMLTRSDMFRHMEQPGHGRDDIASSQSLPIIKIRCPIYWDNECRSEIFNNYLCTCGRLFVFKAKHQKNDTIEPDHKYGFCPCEVCRFYREGLGCAYP
jgi:hypothetical protein